MNQLPTSAIQRTESIWAKFVDSFKAHPVFWVFLLLLPLHTFAMMVLFGALGMPSRVITVLSAWKEVLAFGTAGVVVTIGVVHLFRESGRRAVARIRAGLTSIDWLVILFSIWVIARTLYGFAFGSVIPLSAQVYGLRFYLVPIALYIIGRLIQMNAIHLRRALWGLAIVGGVTGAIAVVERSLSNDVFVSLIQTLGYQHYFLDLVHTELTSPHHTAASMWLATAGNTVRRAGSVYMISKPFALTYLVIIPAGLGLLATESEGRAKRWLQVLLALCWAGLLCSLTRMPIVACVLVLVGMLWQYKRRELLYGLVVGLVLAVASIGIGTYTSGLANSATKDIATSVSGQDASTTEHTSVWTSAIHATLYHPVAGWGVGTANEDSQRVIRTNTTPVTLGAENIFLQVLEELGVVGLALNAAIFIALLVQAWHMHRRGSGIGALLGSVVGWSTVSVLVVGITTPLWGGAFVLTYFYWWLAGQAQIWKRANVGAASDTSSATTSFDSDVRTTPSFVVDGSR